MLLSLLLALSPAHAATLAGVTLADTATVGGQPVVLNGMGLREKYFLDIYVDWPVRKEGDFEFGSGNDLTPYASVSKYVRTNDVAWRFELSNAYVYLEALLSGSHGRGQFTGLYEDPYDVTWKVEQKYYKGA